MQLAHFPVVLTQFPLQFVVVGQFVQDDAVADVVYFPFAQSVQADAPAPEYFPAPQFVQLAVIPPAEYVPAVHCVQTPSLKPNPALHEIHNPVFLSQ